MQTTEQQFSWYDIPEDIKNLLVLASENWENTAESQKYVNEALAKAEDNLDVLVGAYRFFFYKNNSEMAIKIAEKVSKKLKQENNLPDEWEKLQPILAERKNESPIRMYLNAYAAQGFLLARLGKIEEAKEITERVKEIDEKRESCATTVFEVLTQPPEEDE
ncbi:MAG: hypothetical protein IGR93_10920 [Hydrococcus sp. C42_A2020_068]|uniref:hypothetical protein n=1 Tax=Pleurocapsa sp. PCC 7327 TaxID=118163 RepID=UPI00029FA104|nr:hypothetical protein [Pleurocapsa sp. PCC 7327]AFY78853.1 hypothetical protein Ple7327_3660 [Pleurocapsa sp. PCC 7327]MBF2020593.1 hypothetical protein [Hydrococcus sp. C42_A2020_068]